MDLFLPQQVISLPYVKHATPSRQSIVQWENESNEHSAPIVWEILSRYYVRDHRWTQSFRQNIKKKTLRVDLTYALLWDRNFNLDCFIWTGFDIHLWHKMYENFRIKNYHISISKWTLVQNNYYQLALTKCIW